MALIIPNTFVPDTVADANAVNANFTAIASYINSNVFAGYPTYIDATASAYGLATSGTGTANTAALQAAINAVLNGNVGGTVFIPSGTYNFNGPLTISTGGGTGAMIIQGSSGGTVLVQQSATDMFDVTDSQGNGLRFRDLTVNYSGGASFSTVPTCFNFDHSSEVTIELCLINNWPQGLTTSTHCLHIGVLSSTFAYSPPNPSLNPNYNNRTQISFAGDEDYIDNCIVRQQPINSSGPTGCTGVLLMGGEATRVRDNHISDWTTGVWVLGGSVSSVISGNEVQSYSNPLIIKPNVNTGVINMTFVSDNVFTLGNDSVAATAPLACCVVIDTDGGTATNVSGVYLSNNSIYGAFNAGVLINVADSVTIVGGQISGNGLNPSSVAVGAGVAIIGAATNVTIDGVNMSAYNPFLGTNPASQQAYALAVSGSGSASVSNCNMQNNANGALYHSSPGSLSLVNCKGYNTVSLLSSSVPTSTVFTPLVSLGAGWFGPATLYVSGGTVSSVAIGAGTPGVSAATTSGSFQLPATTGFVLTYSMAPTITVLTQ